MYQSDHKSAIILNIAGLRPGMLGPFGNTWFETPNFNRLAADSILYQQCVAETLGYELGYQSMLTGQHPATLRGEGRIEFDSALPELPGDSIFLTDRSSRPVAEIAHAFDRVIQVGGASTVTCLAESVEDTTLARFFAESIDWIENQPEASLYWLDCQGMFGNWDAPYEFRNRHTDPDDPETPSFWQPPCAAFNAAQDDPDQLLGFQQAYSGQMILLDQCLGILLEELESKNRLDQTLVCLYSSTSYPLGEHGVVGSYQPTLNSEAIHVPLMIRWPDQKMAAIRDQNLISPRMVTDAIRAWFDSNSSDSRSPSAFKFHREFTNLIPNKPAQAVFSIEESSDQRLESLQTQAWKLIRGQGHQLYVRPDDVWEVNDVHSRCRDIAQSLEVLMDNGRKRLAERQPFLHAMLADVLAFGVE